MNLLSFRQLIGLLGLALMLLFNTPGFAADAPAAPVEKFQAGRDYDILPEPVRTRDSSKVEVVELFWYGCPHCYHFEPMLKKWIKNKPDYVDFWRSPAMWNDLMKTHAQAFYTAKALGVLGKLHDAMFTTLVVERKQLSDEKEIEDLFAAHGVDRKKFRAAFNSFGVKSEITQAEARARSYHNAGTPELVVNGKYHVTAGKAGSQKKMLEIVNFLVAKEHAAMLRRQHQHHDQT